ncbi:MAG: EAL domain-containing protein [Pseudomonadales bacterium]
MSHFISMTPGTFARWLYCAIGALSAVIFVILLASVQQTFNERKQRGELYARMVESTVTRTLEALETTLHSLADELAAQPLSATRLQQMRERLTQTMLFAPQLRQLVVVRDQETLLDSLGRQLPPLDLNALALGNYQNSTSSRGLVVGKPYNGRYLPSQRSRAGSARHSIIPISLSRQDNQGASLLLLAALNPDYFKRYIDTLPLSGSDHILVTDFSGATLVQPTRESATAELAQMLAHLISSNANQQSFNSRSTFANPQSTTLRLSAKYPLAIAVITCHRDTLKSWIIANRILLLGLLILLLALSAAAVFAVRSKARSYALEQQANLLSRVVESSPTMILITDREGVISYVNRSFEQQTLYNRLETIGRKPSFLKSGTTDEEVYRTLWQRITAGQTWQGEFHNRRRDGSHFWERVSISPLKDSDGQISHFISIKEPIDKEKAAMEKLRLASTVFDASIEAIMVTDAKGRIQMVNRAFENITGYTQAETIGRTPALLKSGRHGTDFYRQLYQKLERFSHWQGEIWNRRKNGEIYPEWLVISSRHDLSGKLEGYVALFSDITKRKQNEALIAHQAHYDKLTGLPNRILFAERLNRALKSSSANHSKAALLFIDLDRFKYVNDTYGHHTGDLLLEQVAQRLLKQVRKSDTVARLGGDEFTVIISNCDALAVIEKIATKILTTLAKPYSLEAVEAHISCSIGIALYPDNAIDSDTLIVNADSAMYRAKHLGRNNYQYFDEALNTHHSKRRDMEKSLHQALSRDQFYLVYQPIFTTDGGAIKALEALIRWRHPDGHTVSPADFIPLAEESTLIHELGNWVLEQSCRFARQLSLRCENAPKVSINTSSLQFLKGDLDQQLAQAMQRHQVNGDALIIELTESALMLDAQIVRRQLEAIVTLGVEVAIDDFGTGYSSLSYLKHFPIKRLKIDKSFVDDLSDTAQSRALFSGILSLAHSLCLVPIVEGVETQAQRDIIRDQGQPLIQGYFYSKPLSETAALTLVSERQAQV